MSKRVSVDAEALQEFIESARGEREGIISEFCVSPAEDKEARTSFEDGVTRLDAKEIREQ
jgi:hypothetical protein